MDYNQHVSMWHPWSDKPGNRHKLTLWNDNKIGEKSIDGIDTLIETVAHNLLYVLCNDPLDQKEFPFSINLLRDKKRVEPYISRTGSVVAVRLKIKRHSGFLIPSNVWGSSLETPTIELQSEIERLFSIFGYEAITPSSLSEKVLRGTLPERTFISRPSVPLRNVLLEDAYGPRIDVKEIGEFYPQVYTYDLNKAYFHFSKCVPSPFHAPLHFYYGYKEQAHYNRWLDFAYSYVKVKLTVHGNGIQPLQVREDGILRVPRQGETIERWLWNFELEDCLNKGYTLDHMVEGYGWHEYSTFMSEWGDILYDKYVNEENENVRNKIKTMMVGLPGRFLKSPETYTLIHVDEAHKGDLPVMLRWTKGGDVLSDWCVRVEPDMQSAQLTPIGRFILCMCRSELYKRQLDEQKRGNILIRSYVDSYTVQEPTKQPEIIGKEVGAWKEKIDTYVWIEENRFIPNDITHMKAPGVSGDKERLDVWRTIHGLDSVGRVEQESLQNEQTSKQQH